MTSVPAPPNLARLSSPGNKEIVGKTPIEWIDSALKQAFGDEYVMLKRCIHPIEMYGHGETHSDMDVVVMDCVLSRSNQINNVKNKSRAFAHHTSYGPAQSCSFHDVDAVNLAIAAQDGSLDASCSRYGWRCMPCCPHYGLVDKLGKFISL